MKKLFLIFSTWSAIFIMTTINPGVWAHAQDGRLFDARMDYATGDYPHSVATGDLNGDGWLDLATANSWWSSGVWVLLHSRRVTHSPRGRVAGPVGAVRYHFFPRMDPSSFALGDDVASFTGPQGALSVADFAWLDEWTLEVTFDAQTTVGEYEMVIGPEILDAKGNPMNIDRDSTGGEVPDDQYIATFIIICKGDFDGDVDGSDISVFAVDFGRTDCISGPDCEGDFDKDGDVDWLDLVVFAKYFGRTDCP